MALGDLTISGDGRRGDDGTDGKGFDGHARDPGVVGTEAPIRVLILGLNGEDGTVATDGKHAQTVHVVLKRATAAPGIHLVVTVDKHYDECAEIFPHTDLQEEFGHELGIGGVVTISACGGPGGQGGSGGSGQGGGHGRDGKNANKDMGGTDGGPGGAGGNAGAGTSGGKGGNAGHIKLVVTEGDLDLLVAVNPPRVQGGRGGKAGLNGAPGQGGHGGRGGAAFTT